MAKDEVARHITIDESEPFGFQINHHGFFPWDHSLDEDEDERLFNLVATRNLCTVDEDLGPG
ncbi:unnamed protein product [Aureobasidium vineae]|uniref:Uncharacterized protein n=1 Tax=Aureobasidium vineae TaxID=2773715 RepID=A0A9N8P5V5_9PEZI|nr:unnamed protein product [Aureobasidium vineae]